MATQRLPQNDRLIGGVRTASSHSSYSPNVPVRFVNRVGITSAGAALIGDFSLWQRSVVVLRERSGRGVGQGRVGAIVASISILASEDALKPVVSVRDVAT